MAVAATVSAGDEEERGMDKEGDWFGVWLDVEGGRGRWVMREMEKDVNSYGAPVAADEIIEIYKEK